MVVGQNEVIRVYHSTHCHWQTMAVKRMTLTLHQREKVTAICLQVTLTMLMSTVNTALDESSVFILPVGLHHLRCSPVSVQRDASLLASFAGHHHGGHQTMNITTFSITKWPPKWRASLSRGTFFEWTKTSQSWEWMAASNVSVDAAREWTQTKMD